MNSFDEPDELNWITELVNVRDYLTYLLSKKNTFSLSGVAESFIKDQLHLIHLFDKNPTHFT